MFRLSSFFFNDTATTEIYTLSLHDALPISGALSSARCARSCEMLALDTCAFGPSSHVTVRASRPFLAFQRSEEHTSELQSHLNLVCRLLLEKKKNDMTST